MIENDGDPQRIAIDKACELLDAEFQEGGNLSIKVLAAKVGLTECHFCRVFKKIKGVTVGEYKRQLAAIQGLEDHSTDCSTSGQTSALAVTPIDAINENEFTYNARWDSFSDGGLLSASFVGSDPMFAQSILTTDPQENNIFDCVDFGDSFC